MCNSLKGHGVFVFEPHLGREARKAQKETLSPCRNCQVSGTRQPEAHRKGNALPPNPTRELPPLPGLPSGLGTFPVRPHTWEAAAPFSRVMSRHLQNVIWQLMLKESRFPTQVSGSTTAGPFRCFLFSWFIPSSCFFAEGSRAWAIAARCYHRLSLLTSPSRWWASPARSQSERGAGAACFPASLLSSPRPKFPGEEN